MEIIININKSVEENAALYFEKAKKAKKKLLGLKEAIKKTEQTIKKEEKNADKRKQRAEEKEINLFRNKKKEWYEKFRWFISKDGFLVIAGRDATTNEIIIKKHLDKDDLVFHTDMPGSPFCVIKTEGKKIDEGTKKEAAQFCASNSKAWSKGLGFSEVYCIKADQVKKELGLPKGTFMIYGKREYFSPELKLCVDIIKEKGVIKAMCGPAYENCKGIIIVPGNLKKSDAAKKIKSILKEKNKEIEKEIEKTISIDEIIQILPPGNIGIEKQR